MPHADIAATKRASAIGHLETALAELEKAQNDLRAADASVALAMAQSTYRHVEHTITATRP